jgi:hypothetical protein
LILYIEILLIVLQNYDRRFQTLQNDRHSQTMHSQHSRIKLYNSAAQHQQRELAALATILSHPQHMLLFLAWPIQLRIHLFIFIFIRPKIG